MYLRKCVYTYVIYINGNKCMSVYTLYSYMNIYYHISVRYTDLTVRQPPGRQGAGHEPYVWHQRFDTDWSLPVNQPVPQCIDRCRRMRWAAARLHPSTPPVFIIDELESLVSSAVCSSFPVSRWLRWWTVTKAAEWNLRPEEGNKEQCVTMH